jgi:hypothetical protein
LPVTRGIRPAPLTSRDLAPSPASSGPTGAPIAFWCRSSCQVRLRVRLQPRRWRNQGPR